MLDMVTVKETAEVEAIPGDDDGPNGLKETMNEATRVNNNF